jgi:hypothetical protein
LHRTDVCCLLYVFQPVIARLGLKDELSVIVKLKDISGFEAALAIVLASVRINRDGDH